VGNQFQFLLVRLKVHPTEKPVQLYEISIPFGAIKRMLCAKLKIAAFLFQFLLVRLKVFEQQVLFQTK